MEAMIGVKTVGQIAREYQIHPVQVTQWKGVIRDRLPKLFEPQAGQDEDAQRRIAQLHEKIGELTVESAGTEVSMDGRGRCLDNRFIERLWRSLKYEDIYLQDYGDGLAAGRGLASWFAQYNHQRPHQALNYATPAEYYLDPDAHGARPAQWA